MEFVQPDFKGKNPGHYSAAVKVGGLMYVSGQLSIDPDTYISPPLSLIHI